MTDELVPRVSPSGPALPDYSSLIYGEIQQLGLNTNITVGDPLTTLVMSSVFTVQGVKRPARAFLRVGVSGRLAAGDTSAALTIELQVSNTGGPFQVLRSVALGPIVTADSYLSVSFGQQQDFTTDADAQYRVQVAATGTATDVITIDPASLPGGFAELSVQIFDRP